MLTATSVEGADAEVMLVQYMWLLENRVLKEEEMERDLRERSERHST